MCIRDRPVAVRWMMGGNSKAPDWGSAENISLAFLTLAIVIVLNITRNATIRRLSILLAIVLGTVPVSYTHLDVYKRQVVA